MQVRAAGLFLLAVSVCCHAFESAGGEFLQLFSFPGPKLDQVKLVTHPSDARTTTRLQTLSDREWFEAIWRELRLTGDEPIVKPGASLVFSEAAVTVGNVTFSEPDDGLLVPAGFYDLEYEVAPDRGCCIAVRINGLEPSIKGPAGGEYPYARLSIEDGSYDEPAIGHAWIDASHEETNLISIVNCGRNLFALRPLPSSLFVGPDPGSVAIMVRVRILRVG